MLQVAFLASHLLWMTTFKDMEELYSMITTYAGKVLGLQNHILQEGGDADLVVLIAFSGLGSSVAWICRLDIER